MRTPWDWICKISSDTMKTSRNGNRGLERLQMGLCKYLPISWLKLKCHVTAMTWGNSVTMHVYVRYRCHFINFIEHGIQFTVCHSWFISIFFLSVSWSCFNNRLPYRMWLDDGIKTTRGLCLANYRLIYNHKRK